jgi:hypothetical protein
MLHFSDVFKEDRHMPIDSYGSSPQDPYLKQTPEVQTPQEPLQDEPLSSTKQAHSTESNTDPKLGSHMADMYGTSALADQQHSTTIYGYLPLVTVVHAGGTILTQSYRRDMNSRSITIPWSSGSLMRQDRIRFTKLMPGHIQPAVGGEGKPLFRLSKPTSTRQGCG